MELSYPALEGINSPKQYSGPIVLLSYLDTQYGGGMPKYPCGHRAARTAMYRVPKVLLGALRKRELLANLPTHQDVILFDIEHNKLGVRGHREAKKCPQCFFEKLLDELDPTCPFCKKRIRHGQNVWLVRYGELNLAQRQLIKVMKVKYDGFSWALCCCSTAKPQNVFQNKFVWKGDSRCLF